MMMFHVPANVSTYIKCGDGKHCNKEGEAEGSFAAWYSCPVCSYRICESCAEWATPDIRNPYPERTVENLFTRQFRKVGEEIKEKEKRGETEKEKVENILRMKIFFLWKKRKMERTWKKKFREEKGDNY